MDHDPILDRLNLPWEDETPLWNLKYFIVMLPHGQQQLLTKPHVYYNPTNIQWRNYAWAIVGNAQDALWTAQVALWAAQVVLPSDW